MFSTHDRHRRTNAPGTCHANTYDPELDPDTDYNYRLVVYAEFVPGHNAGTEHCP